MTDKLETLIPPYADVTDALDAERRRLHGQMLSLPDREELAQELTAPAWKLGGAVPYEIAERAASFIRLPAAVEVEAAIGKLETLRVGKEEFVVGIICGEVQALLRRLSPSPAGEKGTPDARWRAEGKPDPHGDRYQCERSALAGGNMTDDEVANAVFMEPGINNLTIAKDRIRWLSRKLAEAASPAKERRAIESGKGGHDNYIPDDLPGPPSLPKDGAP